MIRETSVVDAPALEAIHCAAFGTDGWSAQMIADQLRVPQTFGLIDDEGGMALARSVVDEAEILTLAVAPQARRRGIGARLLGILIDQARGRGCRMMFLEVSARNLAAQALYHAHGFAPVGLRRRYYEDGSDALIMRTHLCQVSSGAAAELE